MPSTIARDAHAVRTSIAVRVQILTYQEGAPLNYGAIATEIEAWLKFIELNPVQ